MSEHILALMRENPGREWSVNALVEGLPRYPGGLRCWNRDDVFYDLILLIKQGQVEKVEFTGPRQTRLHVRYRLKRHAYVEKPRPTAWSVIMDDNREVLQSP